MFGFSLFFEGASAVTDSKTHSIYQLFAVEPMQNFWFRNFQGVEKSLFRRLAREILIPNGRKRTTWSCKLTRTPILRVCNEVLKRIQNESIVQGIIDDYSSSDCSRALNRLFISRGICVMMEASYYRHVDYMFSFNALFIDRTRG